MYRWTDCKLLLWVPQRILLLAVLNYFIVTESASNEFMPQTVVDSCPGDVLTYTCTIYGGGNTIWRGSAFDCETKMNEIILRHSQFERGSSGNCNDGAITAQSLSVVNNTRFSSQLRVTVDLEMNNRTIQCAHSSETITTVGEGTISVATAPPTEVRLAEVRPGHLTFNWRSGTDNLNYTVNSTCGTCSPIVIMTNTTMVTCSGFTLSTAPTMCTFSVQRVACGTVGNPSHLVMVTLAVPDVPNVKVIPQYSLNDDGQPLTRIIVLIDQNMTSFAITDTIYGSTTGYSIIYGSSNGMQNEIACSNNTCEYTVDLLPTICSTLNDVNVTVSAANLLGSGQPTEPTNLECNNQFVIVTYYSANTSFSCTFLNKSDSSPKSCSVMYGICGQEMSTIQGNAIEGSLFTIAIKLNSSIVRSTDCYIITASNGTYEIMLNGSISLPAMSERADNVLLSLIVIPVITVLVVGVIIIMVVGIILRRRQQHGSHKSVEATVHKYELSVKEDHPQHEDLYLINSKHFIESALTDKCKLNEFRKQKDLKDKDLIFIEYKHKTKHVKICDVILQHKNGRLYTGPYARNMVNNENSLSEWKNVFVLPCDRIKQKQTAGGRLVLYQNPAEKSVKFKVFFVEKTSTLTDFMAYKNISSSEKDRVFYELSTSDKGLTLLHYVEIATTNDSKQLQDGSIVPMDSGIHYFYTVLKAPGEHIKHPGKGLRVFIQGTASSLKQMSLTAGSLMLYKVINKAGAAMSVDDHLVLS